MSQNLTGSYWLLRKAPRWLLTLGLNLICIDAIRLGRKLFEGKSYNVSRSADPGGRLLINNMLLASRILKRENVELGPLQTTELHVATALASAAVGQGMLAVAIWQNRQLGEVMDAYFNLCVAPTMLYMLTTTVPVIWKYGTAEEKQTATFRFCVFSMLLLYDLTTGRLKQQEWLKKHGSNLSK